MNCRRKIIKMVERGLMCIQIAWCLLQGDSTIIMISFNFGGATTQRDVVPDIVANRAVWRMCGRVLKNIRLVEREK